MAERLFLLQQQRRHPAERFGGIDRAGGIVRRVDEHGLHGGGQHPLKRIEIDLEGLRVGGHDAQRQPRARRVGAILREERREGQDFVSGLGHQPESVRQRARRAAGHKNIVHRVAHAEPAVERRGNLFARGGDAQTRAVPVHEHRVAAVQQRLDARVECLRHRHGRIAQAVIEDILRFQVRMPGAIVCVFVQLPNHRFAREHGFVGFVNHINDLAFIHSAPARRRFAPAPRRSAAAGTARRHFR